MLSPLSVALEGCSDAIIHESVQKERAYVAIGRCMTTAFACKKHSDAIIHENMQRERASIALEGCMTTAFAGKMLRNLLQELVPGEFSIVKTVPGLDA